MSTLVEGSVTSLSGRLTELEHVLQSQRTTPVETEDAVANAETWAALEQVMWAELGKVRDQTQDVPRLYALCEKIQQAQQSHEKQLTVLRRFARQVEQHLEQLHKGATPPRHNRQLQGKKVRDIGSLIFETPVQHDYEEGVEVRSLLSSEHLEEMDGRLAVVDVSPSTGARFVKFWVDEIPLQDENVGEGRREIDPSFAQHVGNRTPTPMEQERLETPARRPTGAGWRRRGLPQS